MIKVIAYTDGSCSGNPGPGGWGAVLICEKGRKEISGGHVDTTSCRMEQMAVLKSLESLKVPCEITVYTDSAYVANNFKNVRTWKERGWKGAQNNKIKNIDLWDAILTVIDTKGLVVSVVKVPGHAGVPENERADKLATAETLQMSIRAYTMQ